MWLDSNLCGKIIWILFDKKHYVQFNWKEDTVVLPIKIYSIDFGNTLKRHEKAEPIQKRMTTSGTP